jgi:hypothetical protein
MSYFIIEYGRNIISLGLCLIAFTVSLKSTKGILRRYLKSFFCSYAAFMASFAAWKFFLEKKVYSFDTDNNMMFSDAEVSNAEFHYYWQTLTHGKSLAFYPFTGIFYCIAIVIFFDLASCIVKFLRKRIKHN